MRNRKDSIPFPRIGNPLFPGERVRTHFTDDSVTPKEELSQLHDRWRSSQNPAIIIEAFVLAHRRRVTVPKWVLDPIANVFGKFRHDHLIGKGKSSLDRLFGFTSTRGKKLPPFKRLGKDFRDWLMMRELYMLTTLGFSQEDAANMVSERYRAKTFGASRRHRVPGLSGDTLVDRYKKERWSARFKKSTILAEWPQGESDKTKFLSKFPAHSLPTKRRKRSSK
jgi:hypothetical protein